MNDEFQQLRDRINTPVQGNEWRMMQTSKRIIQVCMDMQRVHGFSKEKTLGGMAIALAEALDNSEKMLTDAMNLKYPAPIMLCSDCPRKDAVLESIK